MFDVWDDVLALIYTFLWPMTRVSACLLATPIFSAMSVNTTVRVSLAMVLTILIYPLHDWPIVDVLSGVGLVLLMEQVVIGVMMGLILQIVFAAVSAAGEFISLSMGLGFAMMVDPNSGVQTPVISQFMVVLATLVFVSIGGHLILIELLLDSFRLWRAAVRNGNGVGCVAVVYFAIYWRGHDCAARNDYFITHQQCSGCNL